MVCCLIVGYYSFELVDVGNVIVFVQVELVDLYFFVGQLILDNDQFLFGICNVFGVWVVLNQFFECFGCVFGNCLVLSDIWYLFKEVLICKVEYVG